MQEPLIFTKELHISTKEPYLSVITLVQELHIFTKEPHIFTKEPHISTKRKIGSIAINLWGYGATVSMVDTIVGLFRRISSLV